MGRETHTCLSPQGADGSDSSAADWPGGAASGGVERASHGVLYFGRRDRRTYSHVTRQHGLGGAVPGALVELVQPAVLAIARYRGGVAAGLTVGQTSQLSVREAALYVVVAGQDGALLFGLGLHDEGNFFGGAGGCHEQSAQAERKERKQLGTSGFLRGTTHVWIPPGRGRGTVPSSRWGCYQLLSKFDETRCLIHPRFEGVCSVNKLKVSISQVCVIADKVSASTPCDFQTGPITFRD